MTATDTQIEDQRTSFTDKCFKDKQGKIVLAQMPNKWLALWLIGSILSTLIATKSTWLFKLLDGFSNLFLVIWALLEIVRGTNYFRRALGAVVLIAVVTMYVMLVKV